MEIVRDGAVEDAASSYPYRNFPQNLTNFPQTHSNVCKNILSHSRSEGSNLGRRTTLSYKRSYFVLSYGDLAVLELRKAAKTCLTFIPDFSAKIYRNFPQNVWLAGKAGKQTCDFLLNVEG